MSVFEYLVLKKYGFSRDIAKNIIQELDKSRWNDFKKIYTFLHTGSLCLKCNNRTIGIWIPNCTLLCSNCAIMFAYPIFRLCENGKFIKIRSSLFFYLIVLSTLAAKTIHSSRSTFVENLMPAPKLLDSMITSLLL